MCNHITKTACKLHRFVERPESHITGRRTVLCSVEAACTKRERDEATCIREGMAAAFMADSKTVQCTVSSKDARNVQIEIQTNHAKYRKNQPYQMQI